VSFAVGVADLGGTPLIMETLTAQLGANESVGDTARVLERQIDLSTEMMGAVAAEARRVTGSRSSIYGARGRVARSDAAAPISVNASL
jgi:hypothetical protein